MQDSKHGYPNRITYQQMDHGVVILVQTDVFCVVWATCWMRRPCGMGDQGHKTTEDFKVSPQLSAVFLEN